MRLIHLYKKTVNRSFALFNEFSNLSKAYSIKYAFYCLGWWFGFYSRNKKVSSFFTNLKQKWLDSYIEEKYKNIIQKYSNKNESKKSVVEYKIWCYWGQGVNKMPPIVKACYHQIKRMNPDKVILLTNENIKNYIILPNLIYEKLKNGKLQYAHFSDILRNSLIAKYGGLWLDVTCWISRPIPQFVVEQTFISPHNKSDGTFWCTYAMGSNKIESITFSFVRDILIKVCEDEITWPDYLFQDRLLSFAYRNIKASKIAIDNTPTNATKRYLLHPLMNQPFSSQIYKQLISEDWVFKLSYKSYYTEKTKGIPTFYSKILDSTINID